MQFEKQIVLASKSPRRKELLERIGIEFTVFPTDFDEKDHLPPEEIAIHNAIGKAQKAASHFRSALVIGVDTIVVAVNDEILGKPKDKQDAKRILRLLSNTTHKVMSGICVLDSDTNKNIATVETTIITMDRLSEEDIDAYVSSGEGEDKAGGYAIQGLGSLYISKIEGDYFNVVGLPINTLRKILQKFGLKRLI